MPETLTDLANVGGPAPTRRAAELTVDQWNDAMRASPLYQNFIKTRGLSASRGGWSRDDQSAWERELARNGVPIPSGMHIDQGGNLNQKNRLGRNAIITGAVAAAALTGFGLAGMGPLSGLGGAGAAGAGGAGAAAGGNSFGASAALAAGGTGAATTAATTGATVAATSPFWSPATLKLTELGVGAGMGIWGTRTADRAARDAADREMASNAETLAYLRSRDERENGQYLEERGRRWTQEDEDRRFATEDRALNQRLLHEREARLAPLRRGSGAYGTLVDLVNLPARPVARAPVSARRAPQSVAELAALSA